MNLSEILGTDLTVARPNPYQLLGLQQGESDPTVIQAALNRVVQQLRASRGAVAPQMWDRAARVVMEAKEILTDPKKKSEYDLKLQVAVGKGRTKMLSSDFPLEQEFARLLPALNPREPFDISRYSTWAQAHAGEFDMALESAEDANIGLEELDFQEPVPENASELSPVDSSSNTSFAPVLDLSPTHLRQVHPRRRGFPIGGVVVGLLCIGLVGVILFLGSRLHQKSISRSTAPSPAETTPIPEDPATPIVAKEPIDPVMGKLAKGPPQRPSRGFKIDDGSSPLSQIGEVRGLNSDFQLDEATMENPAKEVGEPEPVKMAPSTMNADPETPAMDEPSAAAIAAGAQAIEDLRQKLKDLGPMVPEVLVKKAVALGATAEQKGVLASWEQLWDYARQFDQGIRAAGTKMRGGDVLTIADIPINFVESSKDKITFKVQGRIKEYKYTELPPSLADALCRLELSLDQPSMKVARVAYFAMMRGSVAPAAHKEARLGLEKLLQDTDIEAGLDLSGFRDRINELLSP